MRHTTNKNQAGISILEMTVAFTFLTITMIPLFGSMQSSIDSHQMLATRDQLEEKVRRVTAQLAFRLRGATMESLQSLPVFPDSSPTIDFQRLNKDAPYADLPETESPTFEEFPEEPVEPEPTPEPTPEATPEPTPEPTPPPGNGNGNGNGNGKGKGGKSGGNGGQEEGAGLEQYSKITFVDGRLELAVGSETRVIANGLASVQFSRLGRTIVATVRATGRDGSGNLTTVTRRVNVTVRN